MGTSNRSDFLRDETGSSRFWVVELPHDADAGFVVDLKRLLKDRDGIWKAAVEAYRQGESDRLTFEEQAESNRRNLSFEVDHPWEDTIAEASQSRDFSVLTSKLTPESVENHGHSTALPLREPISWRLGMMPYGRDHPDAVTFGDNGIDRPRSSLWMWGDFIGNTGDYIERVDNKLGMLKKARHHYTAAYQGATK